MNIIKRPKYVECEDGSKWVFGTNLRITKDGTVTTLDTQETIQNTAVQTNIDNEEAMSEGVDDNDNATEECCDDEMTESAIDDVMNDIRNVRGIGAKSEAVLRSKDINTVHQLWNAIQNDKQLFEELNKEIRGFQKIVDRVNQMCK